MRGLFFFKDASMCLQDNVDENTVYLLAGEGEKETFIKTINGKDYTCTPFKGYVKYDGYYVGIPMLVNSVLSMIDTINLVGRCFIYEVEIDTSKTPTVLSDDGDVASSNMLENFVGKETKTMKVSLDWININCVSALYVVGVPEMNVLHLVNVFKPEPMVASCNIDLFTDGSGCLIRPTDDGKFEKCSELLSDAVNNHGQLYIYPDMTPRIIKQICCKRARDEADKILEGIPKDSYTEDTLFEEILRDVASGDTEKSTGDAPSKGDVSSE